MWHALPRNAPPTAHATTSGPQNELTGKPVRKIEAAIKVWSHALGSDYQREEIFKTQCIPQLQTLLERGLPEEKFAACGAIHALAQSDKHVAEVVNPRVSGWLCILVRAREHTHTSSHLSMERVCSIELW